MKVKIRPLEDIRTTHKVEGNRILANIDFYLTYPMVDLLDKQIEINTSYLKTTSDNIQGIETTEDCWYIDLTLLEPFSRELVLAYVDNLKTKDV